MRALFSIALGHLRLEMKDRSNAFWMFVMPIAFIVLFGQFFRSGPAPRGPGLRVADGDQSYLSKAFVELLRKEDLTVTEITVAQAESVDSRRTLLLPQGFADSLSRGRRVAARFTPRGGDGADADMEAKIRVYFSVARILGALAEADTASGPGGTPTGPVGAAARDLESPAFQARMQTALARPDRIETRVRTAGKGRALPSGFAASAQSMLVLFLLMNASISGAVTLTQERQARILSRLATLPVTRAQVIGGKVLGLLGMAVAQAVIILTFGGLVFHVWWGPNPLALFVLLACLGLSAAALGIFMGAWLRTPEQAGAVGWLIPLFLGAIGGTWWPLEVAPSWMQILGHVSPAAWAMSGMHGLINFGQGAAAITIPCLVLLLFSIVFVWVGARLLRFSE